MFVSQSEIVRIEPSSRLNELAGIEGGADRAETRQLIHDAVRLAIERIVREELEAELGAAP